MYVMRDRNKAGVARRAAIRFFVVLFWITALVAPGTPVRAQSSELSEADVFTIHNIAVDVTAATAADARRIALAEGQAEALRRMLQRLTRRSDHAALPNVDADQTAFLVQGFEVANEKTSTVRYLADLTVRFKPVEIRRLLRQTGLPFAETASRPVLVLPVLRSPQGLVLWDASNRWRSAWTALPIRGGLVPMIVPFGDISDIADIDASQAMLGDADALGTIAARYDAGSALVALATLSGRDDGQQVLDVAASRPTDADSPPLLLTFTAASAGEIGDLMQRAATQTAAAIEEAWLNDHLIHFDTSQTMTFAIPLSGIGQWATVERKLQSVAAISRFELRVLRRDSAEVRIEYFGDERQLATALAQRGLDLEEPVPITAVPPTYGAVTSSPGAENSGRLRVLRSRGS